MDAFLLVGSFVLFTFLPAASPSLSSTSPSTTTASLTRKIMVDQPSSEPAPLATAADSNNTNTTTTKTNTKQVFGKQVDVDIPDDIFPSTKEIETHEACLVGGEHGWMESCHREPKQPNRRFQLHYRKFLPSTLPPKAIIIWIHGIQTHSGKAYQITSPDNDDKKENSSTVLLSTALLADQYLKQGYALYALDLLGHGFSEGKRFYVKNWKENRDDCISFVELAASEHAKGTPVYVSGESYGGCLSLHVGHAYHEAKNNNEENDKKNKSSTSSSLSLQANVDSVMLIAPAIIGDLPPYPIVVLLRYGLAPLFPLWVPFFMPNPVSADRIWRHPEVLNLHTQDAKSYVIDGSGHPFRLGTAVQLLLATETVRRIIPTFQMPFCVLHGTEDHAVPIAGTEFLAQHAVTPDTDRSVHRLEGAYHDVMGDWPTSKSAMPLLLKWIQQRQEIRSNTSSS